MKNSLKKLTTRGAWFRIQTLQNFTGGIGNHAFAAGSEGFARRNSNQTQIIQIIAPLASSPEQLGAWYIEDYHAEKLIKLIEPEKDVDCLEIWRSIWNGITNLKSLALGDLSKEFFKK